MNVTQDMGGESFVGIRAHLGVFGVNAVLAKRGEKLALHFGQLGFIHAKIEPGDGLGYLLPGFNRNFAMQISVPADFRFAGVISYYDGLQQGG